MRIKESHTSRSACVTWCSNHHLVIALIVSLIAVSVLTLDLVRPRARPRLEWTSLISNENSNANIKILHLFNFIIGFSSLASRLEGNFRYVREENFTPNLLM